MGGDFYHILFGAKGIRARDSKLLATLIFPDSTENIPGFAVMLTLARFVTIVATSMREPGLMPFVLGLPKEGLDWVGIQYPGVIFQNNHIEARNAGSLSVALGIITIEGESRGAFDLVGFIGKDHTLQLLCHHGYPIAFRICSPADQVKFGGRMISDLLSEFQRPEMISREGGYGRFLTPREWQKYEGIVKAAVCAEGIEAPIAVMGHSRIRNKNWWHVFPESMRPGVSRLQNLVGLAEATFRPSLPAMRQTRGFSGNDPLRVNWKRWIPSKRTPRILIPDFDFPAREKLLARSVITEFLTKGGMTWADLTRYLTPRQKQAFADRFHAES